MDLAKLKQDWQSDPCLGIAAFDTVEELSEQLLKTHRFLMSDQAGLVGYLYQQQTRRLREAQKEQGHEQRSERQAGRRRPLQDRL